MTRRLPYDRAVVIMYHSCITYPTRVHTSKRNERKGKKNGAGKDTILYHKSGIAFKVLVTICTVKKGRKGVIKQIVKERKRLPILAGTTTRGGAGRALPGAHPRRPAKWRLLRLVAFPARPLAHIGILLVLMAPVA